MKQATHAWIAIRAVALLEGDEQSKGLVSILLRGAQLFDTHDAAPRVLPGRMTASTCQMFSPGLVKPSVKAAAIGAWLPDLQDSKLGSGDTDNHVFKMAPYGNNPDGSVVTSSGPQSDILQQAIALRPPRRRPECGGGVEVRVGEVCSEVKVPVPGWALGPS